MPCYYDVKSGILGFQISVHTHVQAQDNYSTVYKIRNLNWPDKMSDHNNNWPDMTRQKIAMV
jgi:hypothetical protein